MLHKFRFVAMAAVASAVTLGGFGGTAQAEIQSMNLRWAHFAPPTWGAAQADQKFADEITRLTDGKVKIQIFWSGALGGPNEIKDLLASGAIDIGSFAPSYHPSNYPLLGVINSMPMAWSDPGAALDMQEKLLQSSEGIKAEMKANNTLIVLSHGIGPNRLQCTMPLKSVEDLKNKRIRSFGEWPPFVLQKVGAVPVNVLFGEQYEALMRGTIDCALNPIENGGILKLGEVAKHWSSINLGAWAGYSTFVNQEVFEKYPEELRKVFKEAAATTMEWEKANYEAAELAHLEEAAKMGAAYEEFPEQEKLDAMFPDMLGEWKKVMCERDLCAQAEGLIADLRALESQ